MTNDFFSEKQSFFSIIKIAFGAFRQNPKYIALAGLLIILPLNLILLLIPMPPAEHIQDFLAAALANPNTAGLLDSPEVQKLIGYIYSVIAAIIIFNPLTTAAAAFLAYRQVHSLKPDFHGFLDATIVKWGKHIVTSLLYNLLLGVLVMLAAFMSMTGTFPFAVLLMIPTVTYGVGFSFYSVVVAITDQWSANALKVSYRVVRGRLLFNPLRKSSADEPAFEPGTSSIGQSQLRSALGITLLAWVLSYVFAIVSTLLLESLLQAIAVIAPGVVLTVINLICCVIFDSIKLLFQIIPAVWFINRLYTAGYGAS